MDEQPVSPAIRVVIAAPFPEIVGLHERVAEYADQLDVCGAVMDASGVVDQTRVLQPEVLVLSDRLAEVADVVSRLAAVAPATRVVLLTSDPGSGHPSSLADGTVGSDAAADVLRRTIVEAAGRHLPDVAPAAHAREGPDEQDNGSDAASWFWEAPTPNVLPLPSPPGGDDVAVEPQTEAGDVAAEPQTEAGNEEVEAAGERRWPPPWFRTAPEAVSAVPDAEVTAGETDPPVSAEPSGDQPSIGWNLRDPSVAGPSEAAADADAPPPADEAGVPDAEAAPPPPPETEPREAPAATVAPEDATTTEAEGEPATEVEPQAEPEPEPEFVPAPPVRRRKRPGRARAETILIFSGKGGVGKSVIATNLAVALSKAGSAVAVVDLNLQYGDVGVLLHLEAHPTSIEALAQQGEQVDREFLDEVMATGPEQVRALLAPTSPEFADLVTAANLRAILREMSRSYDYIIIDSASHLEELVLEVMEMADQVLLVTTFNITAVKDAKITLKLLESLGIEPERVAVILNQTKAKIGFPRSDIEKSLRVATVAHLPYEPRIDDTIDTGKPMVLTEPRSDFAKQVQVIVEFLTPEEVAPTDAGDRQKSHKRRFGFGR